MRRDALVARPGKDGKTWWHKIGSSWISEKGETIFLDSLPLTDKDGKCSFILREPKPKADAVQPQRQPVAADMDDEAPF